jgi:hypothetical protein
MLRKFSLIGVGAAALFLPLPALAGSAFQGGATSSYRSGHALWSSGTWLAGEDNLS